MFTRLIAVFAALILALQPAAAAWSADDAAPAKSHVQKAKSAKAPAKARKKAVSKKAGSKKAKDDGSKDDGAKPAPAKSACAPVKGKRGKKARRGRKCAAAARTPAKFAPFDSHMAAEIPPPESLPAEPVKVDEYQRHYEGPKSSGEAAYQAGIDRARQAADHRLGPLEGSWVVSDAKTQKPVLAVVLSDPGPTEKNREIEGAWRDMELEDETGNAGFLSKVANHGDEIEIVFTRKGENSPAKLSLKRGPDGAFSGTLSSEAGKSAVVMRRKEH